MPAVLSRRPSVHLALGAVALAVVTGCATPGSDNAAATGANVAGVDVRPNPKLHDMLPDQFKDSGQVRVATDVPYAPFEMFVTEGEPELTGLDVDLGRALGAKIGVAFVFTPQKFDGIVPGIQAGKFDLAMSALTDSKERQQVLDFVDYTVSGSAMMVAKGNPGKIGSLDDLCGKD